MFTKYMIHKFPDNDVFIYIDKFNQCVAKITKIPKKYKNLETCEIFVARFSDGFMFIVLHYDVEQNTTAITHVRNALGLERFNPDDIAYLQNYGVEHLYLIE